MLDEGLARAKAAASALKQQGAAAAGAAAACEIGQHGKAAVAVGAGAVSAAVAAVSDHVAAAADKLDEIAAEKMSEAKKLAQGTVVSVTERLLHDVLARKVAPKLSEHLGADPDMPDAVANVISRSVRTVCRELEVEIVTGTC